MDGPSLKIRSTHVDDEAGYDLVPSCWNASGREKSLMGYLYMILSLTCFGLLGILAKVADLRECKPGAVYTLAYGWSLLVGVLFVSLFRGADFQVPPAVYAIALPFGAASVIGGMVFLAGIRYGKISTSWLIINLSAAIPAIGSIVLYHERVNPRKIAVVALAAVSVFLLWKDKQSDEARHALAATPEGTP
jgi:drug/metabolite transporter (DMT)-like permease